MRVTSPSSTRSPPGPGLGLRLGLASMAAMITLSSCAGWLQGVAWPALGLDAAWAHVASGLLALALAGLFASLSLLARPAPASGRQALWHSARTMPLAQAAQDLRSLPAYLDVVGQQLEGALKESEQGSLQLIERMNEIHRGSIDQFERIRCTETNGQELTRIMQDKAMVDSQLGAILQMFVETQEAELQANVERLQRLQEVKALAPLVDVIATVARQTNFMSINAAIEAARAGESGRSFAVLAAEIRELSNRTAAVAVDIGQRINAATEGIDQELVKVTEASNRQTTTGNMRKVISDIAEMQQRFVDSMDKLQWHQVIDEVKIGHQAIEVRLSDALGEMQVQDVVRQRVVFVQQALKNLDAHLHGMADQLVDKAWQPDAASSLKARLDEQLVERQASRQVNPSPVQSAASAPGGHANQERIELF
jgi:methyl-accepting chemotaxis protein